MKEGRLHLRLDEELLQGIREYAKQKRTTLTMLVSQHFAELLEEEAKYRESIRDAEQI